MVFAIVSLALLGFVLGSGLAWAHKAMQVPGDSRVDELEALLPGGQCGQCGEPGCRQAAQSMVNGSLAADCCPPGGRALATAIATLLGVELADGEEDIPVVAVIDESQCSGCTRCFKACPFDAIVGANRQMHTVLTQICTGCRLCEKACKQGCLTFEPLQPALNTWQWPKPQVA